MAMPNVGVAGGRKVRGEIAAKGDRNTKACRARPDDAPAESGSDRRKSSIRAVRLGMIVRFC
ncbi:hypothetical protein ACELLULO517_21795 [Acidisoma cellulosilytica]|uniref:Uncharacterized protein n=1 Tax=Acidisoma cellulosilyticum TaxID=2802395 RepID=A0A963Z4U7_9PROT|nr:hypothetical protein [Acidisoma cellulosilyticum]MCB8882895.1 hypothetical protein [Acidisoma cellulosilyticum]